MIWWIWWWFHFRRLKKYDYVEMKKSEIARVIHSTIERNRSRQSQNESDNSLLLLFWRKKSAETFIWWWVISPLGKLIFCRNLIIEMNSCQQSLFVWEHLKSIIFFIFALRYTSFSHHFTSWKYQHIIGTITFLQCSYGTYSLTLAFFFSEHNKRIFLWNASSV
jgi:hypothetical protein